MVTIGLPIFNSARTLEDCLRSIYAQTWQDWELIIADDGSTDDGPAMLGTIRDPRVRVMIDGRRAGLVARLNQIADLACGELLARMDADDLMHPNRLERQVQFLRGPGQYAVAGTAAYSFTGSRSGWRHMRSNGSDQNLASVLRHGFFVHPTVMGRTEWFRQNRYDEGYRRAEDLELWCRTCGNSRYGRIEEPLLFYRIDGGATGYRRKYEETHRTLRRIYRRFGPDAMGWGDVQGLILSSYAKVAAITVLDQVGWAERIQQQRGRPASGPEIREIESALEIIGTTSVPWDSDGRHNYS